MHLIISSNSNKIDYIVRDLKKYTSKQIIKAMQENNTESRKECLLRQMAWDTKYI
jgi:putative transposase